MSKLDRLLELEYKRKTVGLWDNEEKEYNSLKAKIEGDLHDRRDDLDKLLRDEFPKITNRVVELEQQNKELLLKVQDEGLFGMQQVERNTELKKEIKKLKSAMLHEAKLNSEKYQKLEQIKELVDKLGSRPYNENSSLNQMLNEVMEELSKDFKTILNEESK